MKIKFRAESEITSFVITELEPAYHDVVLGLYFTPFEGGFAKQYPTDTPHLEEGLRADWD